MNFIDWLPTNLNLGSDLQTQILGTLLIFAVLWLLRLIILQFINYRVEDIRTRYYWRKFSTYTVVILGIALASPVWLTGIQSLATFLGLAAAGVVIALQDVLANFTGWMFILTRRPFEVGDRVQIGNLAGDVIDIRIFEFSVLEIGNWVDADQSTGRILHIPNGKVFKEALANFNKGFEYIWHEIPVFITFESNWEKAKTTLEEIVTRDAAPLSPDAAEKLKRATNRYLIRYSHLTPTVYTKVGESGVILTIRYLCDPRRRRSSEQAIWEGILRAFAQHDDIEFAYPTQRFYQRQAKNQHTLETINPLAAGPQPPPPTG
jgi:small-conductance mechanosensitive channel